MAWDYAELSKTAKAVGGPEALTDFLIQSGRNQMVPWMAGIGIIGIGAGVGITKMIDFIKERRKTSDQAVEVVKQELIQGINEYDTNQKSSNPGNADL